MRIEHRILELRPAHPFRIARASDPTHRRNVWVRLIAGDGAEGWGEAAATPFYGESAETVAAALPRYAAALADEPDPPRIEAAERRLLDNLGGNPSARAALSAALHDLEGKRLGQPVWRLWGLDPAAAPLSSYTIAIGTPDEVRARAREAADRPILKIKLGSPEDEALLRAIRDEAPAARVRVDANTAWTEHEALARLPMLADYRVELLEQPLPADDLDGLARLRRRSPIPIVADESCETLADVALLAGRVDGINIKLAKCGSLREARRMIDAARAHGLRVMLGCMLESTLGIAAAAVLAPLVDDLDLDGAALLASDPFDGPRLRRDGTLSASSRPGLGVEAAGA